MNRREFLKRGVIAGVVAAFSPQALAAALEQGQGRKTLILGGSAFALGYALAHPEDTVVLERGILLAPEFSATGDYAAPGAARSPLGRKLLAALEKCGLLRDGKVELPPLADFLSEFFASHGGRAFLNAELVSVETPHRGSFRLGIFGSAYTGVRTFSVERFFDTTPTGWRDLGADAVKAKFFRAITDRGAFAAEVSSDADWHRARLALHEEFARRGDGASILAEANGFEYSYGGAKVERKTSAGFVWKPSAQYSTLLDAFEEGAAWNTMS
jgi:hypothetical protein